MSPNSKADWCQTGHHHKERRFEYEVLHAPEQGTDEWLQWRKQGITATEAGSIMFPDKYGSPLKVYTDKLGLTTNDQSDHDGFLEWGHKIEDLLIDKFMENHKADGFHDMTHGHLYQREWCKCSLDGQCFDASGEPVIIECKTGQNASKWDPIPDRYYAQVQWQMYVTGIRKCFFAVLIRGHEYFEREVQFNHAFVDKMVKQCFKVWDCIQIKQPPAGLGFFAVDKEAINAIAGESGHKGAPLAIDDEIASKFINLKYAYEKAEKEFTEYKNEIAFKMVDVQQLSLHGKTFASWVERKGTTTIDKDKLKKKYPEIYNEVQKQGGNSRYIKFSV